MLKMFYPEEDYFWNAAGLVHVNNRLKEQMESIVDFYVDSYDNSYTEHIKSVKERNQPIEDVIDLTRLRNDADFSKYLYEVGFAPEHGWERSASAFVSLYMLLCVKGVYKADLLMEYILLNIIESEIDEINTGSIKEEFDSRLAVLSILKERPECDVDVWEEARLSNSGIHMKVVKIPEPARSFMAYTINESGALEDYNNNIKSYVPPVTTDYFLNRYEDIAEYPEWCFEDHDCLLLNEMSAEEITRSGLAAAMDIHIDGDTTVSKVKLPGTNSDVKFRMAPWETEFMDMKK